MPRGVWNYDPISRGLKLFTDLPDAFSSIEVWNYDPISRGLKPISLGSSELIFFRCLEL